MSISVGGGVGYLATRCISYNHMVETSRAIPSKIRKPVVIAGLIGLVICLISLYLSYLGGKGGGDFKNILDPTRSWLAGNNIYLPFKLNLDPFAVPYPFTAYLASVPFTFLQSWIASAIFLGLGSGVLAWLILRSNSHYYLLVFLSWPFVYNLMLAQFAPWMLCLFFSASFLPLILIKPQLALPFALTQRPNRLGLILTGILLVASFIFYPMWPLDWLASTHTQNYIGSPPIFILPLGPLILLALLQYREKRSWILVLFGLMPQRMVYDQLGVLSVAGNRKQMIILVVCSWISFPVLFIYQGWKNVPFGWQQWVILESYLPALIVILAPQIKAFLSRWNIKSIFAKS